MQIFREVEEFKSAGHSVCLAIGMFDGAHLGHQEVLRQTVSDAKNSGGNSIALTFDRHPTSVIAPTRSPKLIYSLNQKLREIEKLGIDAVRLLSFTPEFSRIPAEQFVRSLVSDFGKVTSISVGREFTFGHKRSGNFELLQRLGKELGFQTHGVPAFRLGGKVVSSTRIREAIGAGDFKVASEMLGRVYSTSGKVIQGDQLGRKLGYPTANIECAELMTPPHGVYAVKVLAGSVLGNGVVNIGVRPTIANPHPQLRMEVHLLDYSGDLYGQELELAFLGVIRPERKFSGLEELQHQIAKDIESARKFFV
ncbi:MAG: bifunctional riboflavin kinase/FAD synthetase [Verrucomicrobiota bacterium]